MQAADAQNLKEARQKAAGKRSRLIWVCVAFAIALLTLALLLVAVWIAIFLLMPSGERPDPAINNLLLGLAVALWLIFGFVGLTGISALIFVGISLEKSVPVHCDNCGKYVATNKPWVCGYCNSQNKGHWYTVLYQCRNCKARPRGIHCPHCGQGVFPGEQSESRHWARMSGAKSPTEFELDRAIKGLTESHPELRVLKTLKGEKIVVKISLNPASGRVRIDWLARPEVEGELRVKGYAAEKLLFSEVGRSDTYSAVWQPGEYPCRLEARTLDGADGAVDHVSYAISVPKAAEPEPEPEAEPDPVAAAIQEVEAIIGPLVARDEWAYQKERQLREEWAGQGVPSGEIDRRMLRFKSALLQVKQFKQ